ncbi:MAG: short chain dehydrogenase [Candidatus Solibacter sp.]|nr:short chain dehydrogenase [Candidatus Solibacter sp.]
MASSSVESSRTARRVPSGVSFFVPDWFTLTVMKPLSGKIALVGGASRGAGRGIALALGEAGATVYIAARTSRERPAEDLPGTVEDTASEVTARGGAGIPAVADLSDPQQTAALFQRIEAEQGRLDLLVNSAWSLDCMPVWSERFWDLSPELWMQSLASLQTYWLTSSYAARIMSRQRSGLILHVTDNLHDNPSGYRGQVLWDMSHEALNRLIVGMAADAGKAGFTVAGINPGFMRTERVLKAMRDEATKKMFHFDLSESPEYIGRAAAALAGDPKVAGKNGKLLWVADLATEYDFTDVDGRRIPRFNPFGG